MGRCDNNLNIWCQSPIPPVAVVLGIDAIYGVGDCHLKIWHNGTLCQISE